MINSISSNAQHEYLFYVPINAWLHHQLHGWKTVCFLLSDTPTREFITNFVPDPHTIVPISEYKQYRECTITQVARFFGFLEAEKGENVMLGDVDMLTFKEPPPGVNIYGSDLVGNGQYPMQYTTFTGEQWDKFVPYASYKELLDSLNFNNAVFDSYWYQDQIYLHSKTSPTNPKTANRFFTGGLARGRVDRANWKLPPKNQIIDAHLCRPGWTEENFKKLINLLTLYFNTTELQWLYNYCLEYKKFFKLPNV